MDRELQNVFLTLVRLGIEHPSYDRHKAFDWNSIQALADKQGLSAIIVDGIGRMPESNRPPKMLLLQWIGEVWQLYEQRYKSYKQAIADLSGFYNAHGCKMMVLKGYACSLDWPKPEHRPCGDIDIWQFGKQKEADALLEKEKGLNIDTSHHHHTVFNWRGFTVENHYDFVNVHAHKSSRKLEEIFKELGQDDSNFVELIVDSLESVESGEKKVAKAKVYLPSPNLHALFLLRHMVSHFAAAEINLRQVLDWAFFVEKHTKEVDWKWFLGVLGEYHMTEFFNLINAICIEDLGFNAKNFPELHYLPELKQRVLEDILNPEYGTAGPLKLIPRLVYKYKRWQGNAWKQKMCYDESRWSAFWSGIKNHLLKPSSI
jgi:hypothetical protein